MIQSNIKHLTSRYTYTGILLIIGIVSMVLPCLSLYAGLILCALVLWKNHWQWRVFGLTIPDWRLSIPRAIAYSIILFVSMELVISPILQYILGDINYVSLDRIKGNPTSTFKYLLLLWLTGAIGKELVFRGLFFRQLYTLWDNTPFAIILAAIFSSMLFGLTYSILGIPGILYGFLTSLALTYIFFLHREDLILSVLVHGLFFSYKVLLIYFNVEHVISHYIINQITN